MMSMAARIAAISSVLAVKQTLNSAFDRKNLTLMMSMTAGLMSCLPPAEWWPAP
jgi:hypothetical protein